MQGFRQAAAAFEKVSVTSFALDFVVDIPVQKYSDQQRVESCWNLLPEVLKGVRTVCFHITMMILLLILLLNQNMIFLLCLINLE